MMMAAAAATSALHHFPVLEASLVRFLVALLSDTSSTISSLRRQQTRKTRKKSLQPWKDPLCMTVTVMIATTRR